jgi:ribosome recycling factor
MEKLADPSNYLTDPGLAWKRIRQTGRNPQVLGRMKALAAWRETEAQHKNIPRGRIMRDETLADIASHPPKNQADLAKVRTGRAHAGMLDHIQVDYYGTATHIGQVANITLLDARTIGVQPWEKKMITTVEKAIRDSDLGLNPSTQGDLIRVPTPALTEERRKEMVKLVKSEAEDAKIAVRNIRRDANESLKKLLKDKAISEDDERRAQDDVQKLTDKFVAEIDKLVVDKEKEVLTV